MQLQKEHYDAMDIARQAGKLLLSLQQRLETEGYPAKEIKAQGDKLSHNFILNELSKRYPHDPVLSEEGQDDKSRLESHRVWIIDPLDGTREFGEAGRSDWAVHVALALDGEPKSAAVALPACDLVLNTFAPPTLSPRISRRLRIVVSRTRAPQFVSALAQQLNAELIEMGSAGVKAMAVVRGEADVYIHAGGQFEWDSAAPVGVARSAGVYTSRINGTELKYNQPNPWLPDLLICRPEIADHILRVISLLIEKSTSS
ncbi:3'(2'),5'-bisphosphate nucleotidase CysQ [Dictyobacter kobayashii]|uniref:3'(2'),5'-bisphosphate nucleotidase CysQ n=1 Tax=Dictyobacter kobayashii TaxID=2014872 RepID=A0A402ACB1_9CHLR|nr:3'(2'),5'-bisphosphate nucleotidase CysQ [Dictyobacter kobayashii]GCE16721.1 3'(2'),5'-bisphosphate nucleotidase CysQ [Dictyobacter kobayashii]